MYDSALLKFPQMRLCVHLIGKKAVHVNTGLEIIGTQTFCRQGKYFCFLVSILLHIIETLVFCIYCILGVFIFSYIYLVQGSEGTHATVCLRPTYKRGWQASGSQGSTYLCVPSCGIESVPGIRLSTLMTAPLPRPDLVLLIP